MTTPTQPVTVPVALPPVPLADIYGRFAGHRRLSVKQKKRWLEILFDWESKNSYGVFDEDGHHVLQVKENGGFVNVLLRMLLQTARPFSATVFDNPIPRPLLQLRRPFRFLFHRIDVATAGGEVVGSVVRRWSWIRRVYSVQDAEGKEVAILFGPFFRPWTFEVRIGERVIGTLQKKWSGLLKELVTDADNFVLELPDAPPQVKVLVFAATVLVDVVHFEKAAGQQHHPHHDHG
jgi:uncharacterized protein YxjI